MKTKEKGDLRRPEYQHKDSHSSLIIKTILNLFLSGRKLTAIEINSTTGSNDARKVISVLRKAGWKIADMWLPSGRKLYWLAEPDKQLNLF